MRDAAGRLAAIEDHHHQVAVTFERDAAGRLTALEDRTGRRVTYGWASGRLVEVVDVLGRTSAYAYDSHGRMTWKSLPSGEEVTISYGSTGLVASVLDADGVGTYFDFDYSSATGQTYAAAIHTDGTIEESWYDAGGALLKRAVDGTELAQLDELADPSFGADGQLTATLAADGSTLASYSHDEAGRVVEMVDARGQVTTYAYDDRGNLIELVRGAEPPAPYIVTHEYDEAGLEVAKTRGGWSGTPEAHWTYAWDDDGNRIAETDPLGRTTSREYNALRQVVREERPDGSRLERDYDDAGQLLEERLVPADGSEPLVLERRTYGPALDAKGRTVGVETTVRDADGVETIYRSDVQGRLVEVRDAWGRKATRSFDGHGRVVETTNMAGVVTTFTYEPLPFGMTRITRQTEGFAAQIEERDPYGRVTRRDFGGVEVLFLYDGASPEPSEIVYPTYRELVDYDALGRVVGRPGSRSPTSATPGRASIPWRSRATRGSTSTATTWPGAW